MVRRLQQRVVVALLAPCAALVFLSCGSGDEGGSAPLALAPGGFVEKAGSAIRPRWSANDLQDFLPKGRGKFTFPAPYHTEATRLTAAEDCKGDCVFPLGYSYWRNMNNHVGSNEILIFLGLDRSHGGAGPTLFSYDKTTQEVTKRGPLFEAEHRLSWSAADGWYFSASQPTTLYINDGPHMLRYDVLTHASEVVYDVSSEFGSDRETWQMSSSNDDQVHAATLREKSTKEYLGCLVYQEATKQFRFFAKVGVFDECQIDKSGRFLVIFEDIDGRNGNDNRHIDLLTGTEERFLSLPGVGAVGHHDMGFGYLVGHDKYNPLPNATLSWTLSPYPVKGAVDNRDYNWDLVQVQHISHTNAQPGIPKEQQYVCGSNADRVMYAQNEILCFRLDGSLNQLVVAPVMTTMDASGGRDDYHKVPKGNLDVTGQYFIWTTNLGSNRLDAFIVRVPGHLL
jgi:hypothetical protein